MRLEPKIEMQVLENIVEVQLVEKGVGVPQVHDEAAQKAYEETMHAATATRADDSKLIITREGENINSSNENK